MIYIWSDKAENWLRNKELSLFDFAMRVIFWLIHHWQSHYILDTIILLLGLTTILFALEIDRILKRKWRRCWRHKIVGISKQVILFASLIVFLLLSPLIFIIILIWSILHLMRCISLTRRQ